MPNRDPVIRSPGVALNGYIHRSDETGVEKSTVWVNTSAISDEIMARYSIALIENEFQFRFKNVKNIQKILQQYVLERPHQGRSAHTNSNVVPQTV